MRNLIQEIKAGHNASFKITKLPFALTALSKLLNQNSMPSAWDFYNTYLSSRFPTRKWFKSYLKNIFDLAEFDKITTLLSNLKNAGLLNEGTCNRVVNHPNLDGLATAFNELMQAQILTQANFDVVASQANPQKLVFMLSTLENAGILTHKIRTLVASHVLPTQFPSALYSLQQAGILTPKNFNVLVLHRELEPLADMLSTLQQAEILTQEIFNTAASHAEIELLNLTIYTLSRARILTQTNFNAVASHSQFETLNVIVNNLKRAGILTQDNLDALLAPDHALLLMPQACELIWGRIPTHLLTQANFQRLLTAVEHDNPIETLAQEVIHILIQAEAGAQAVAVAAFNQGQSTHTASVHRSVSKSARALWSDYNPELNLDKTIINIKAYVNGLDDSPKNQAAKRCIERITTPDHAFVDNDSGVSTQQLLALAWLALHDDQKRLGSLQDAKSLFVEGLYEIQRGYNLSEEGIDNEEPDQPICLAGTFNKIVEKLVGIHPNIEVQFITHQGALQKILKLAPQHALNFLKALAVSHKAQVSQLIEKLLKDGNLESIWGHIKDRVQADIWGEFAEAYSGNQEHPKFQELIAYGGQIGIPDEDELRQILTPSQAAHSMFAASADVEQKEEPEKPKP